VEYIPLITDGEVMGMVSKLIVENERIIVSDRQSNAIFVFDLSGKLINKIFKFGKGVGEYVKISDFCFDSTNDLIIVLDRNQGKIIQYDIDGSLVDEIKLPKGFYSKIYLLDQSNIVIYAGNEMLSEYNYKIIDRENGKVVNHFGPIDREKSRFLNFLTHSNFYQYENNIYTYQIADDGRV